MCFPTCVCEQGVRVGEGGDGGWEEVTSCMGPCQDMYACMCVCLGAYVCVSICQISLHEWVRVCVCVCVCVCVRVCVCVCVSGCVGA